jgi:hypothetical protein
MAGLLVEVEGSGPCGKNIVRIFAGQRRPGETSVERNIPPSNGR